MPVPVKIPSPLRPFAGGESVLQVEATSVAGLLAALASSHKELATRLTDESGKLRGHVRIFVNDEDIRFLEEEKTPLKAGDTVAIVPAIAGG